MKIAIIGMGFSGLACALNLLTLSPHIQLTLFDQMGIGGGASGVAAGLLHPYSGLHAKLNRFGKEGFEETEKLLKISSNTLEKDVALKTPLLRVATSPALEKDYFDSSQKNSSVAWKPHLAPHWNFPGIVISSCYLVDCPLYLQGLWKACERLGAHFVPLKIDPQKDLKNFDTAIFATGAYQNFPQIPIHSTKGQILEINKFPTYNLNVPVNSQSYLLKNLYKDTLIAGATFERDYCLEDADVNKAKEEIFSKLRLLYPDIDQAEVVDCRAGLRASTPNHLPLIKKLDPKTWLITGMGSKGLLYHALYAKQLAIELIKDI